MSPELTQRITSGVILRQHRIILTVIRPHHICADGQRRLGTFSSVNGRPYQATRLCYVALGAFYVRLHPRPHLHPYRGREHLLAVLAIVWTGDIAAYFVGKKIR